VIWLWPIRIDSLARYFAGQVFAADGRCKTFDASADSFGRGEGCGVVVLKRLSEAMADGDNILAVIRGSMINQDGRTNGMTAPNGTAQQAVIRQALTLSRIEPEQVDYIEAHGTGTSIGDPVEIEALNAVFGKRTEPLWVGSVKSNMGHLEGAAGIVGLMKAILVLQHSQIPPNLHFNQPNTYIDWESSPVQIPTQLTPWTENNTPRIAGVSSFGFSGTNAHVVLAEASHNPQFANDDLQSKNKSAWQLLTLSAKTSEALAALAQQYHEYFLSYPDVCLEDVSYTAQTGRTHFRHRLSIIADSPAMMQTKLKAFGQGQTSSGVSQGHQIGYQSAPKITFLFTGQGSQYLNMGRALYDTEPVFRQALDRCNEQLTINNEQFSLLDILYPERENQELDTDSNNSQFTIHNSQLDQTAITQPVLFALEYALTQLWQSWGIKPTVVMGHSLGELVAACVAGIFSLEDALKLVAARGQLMQAMPQNGAMVSVMADEAYVQKTITPHSQVAIAAVNGPQHVVISGEQEAIQSIVITLQAEGVKTHSLNVSHAFHSPLMDPILVEFEQVAQSISYNAPQIAMISNVSGQLIPVRDETLSTPDYWVRHTRECVRFSEGVATLNKQDIDIFIEIGPKPTLLSLAQQCISVEPSLTWLPSLRPHRQDTQQMLESLGTLYTLGVQVDWAGVSQGRLARKIVLPTYPFQRQSYWLDIPTAQSQPQKLSPLLDRMIKLPQHNQIIFETRMSVANIPFLADHQVYNSLVVPGAAYMVMAFQAANLIVDGLSYRIDNMVLLTPLIIPNEESRTVQLMLTSMGKDQYEFRLISFTDNELHTEPMTHTTGQIKADVQPSLPQVSLDEVQRRCAQTVDLEQWSADLGQQQVTFGPTFQWLDAVWQATPHANNGPAPEVLAKLQRPAVVGQTTGYLLHPGLVDACFQVAGFAHSPETKIDGGQDPVWLPFAINQVRFYQPINGDQWWCQAQQVAAQTWNIQLLDTAGQMVADITGFQVRAAPPDTVLGTGVWRKWLYKVDWQPTPLFGLPPDYLSTPNRIHQTLAAITLDSPELPPAFSTTATMQRYQTALNHLEAVSLD